MATATVRINNPSGYFNGTILYQVGGGTGSTLVSLADGVTGATGDGAYEVVFVKNELATFGSGTNGPAIHVIKIPPGSMPSGYSPNVLKLHQFTVQNGAIIGYKDIRQQGGVSNQNFLPGTINASILANFQLQNLTDVSVTDASVTNGSALVWNSSTQKWTAGSGGGGGGGSSTLAGLSDVNVTEGPGINGYVLTWNQSTGKWIASPSSGGGGGGSSYAYPFSIVQENVSIYQVSGTPSTMTFDKTATAGNTLLVIGFGAGNVGVPGAVSGWTLGPYANSGGSNFASIWTYYKTASGSETSFTPGTGNPQYSGYFFFELSGTHSLDASNTASPAANAALIRRYLPPTITPSPGSMIFSIYVYTENGSPQVASFNNPSDLNYKMMTIYGSGIANARVPCLYVGVKAGGGSVVQPAAFLCNGTSYDNYIVAATFSML